MIDKTKYKFADIIFTLYYDWIFYTCISPIVPGVYYHQCWAVTSYCNLVTVIILLFAVTSSVTILLIRFQ